MELTPITRPCPRCAGDAYADLGLGRDPWRIGRCEGCGFVYLTAAASYEDLSELYAWETAYPMEAARKRCARPAAAWLARTTRWRLKLFPRASMVGFLTALLPEGGDIIDLGCGDGQRAEKLPPQFVPHGVEISRAQAAAADALFSARGGRCIHAPCIAGLGAFGEQRFDGAVLNSYLEHDPEPMAVLTALRAVLKPGGLAVVKAPNFASWNSRLAGATWCGIRLPDHVNYFTPASLADMAAATGFRTDFPRPANLPTNDNLWALLWAKG